MKALGDKVIVKALDDGERSTASGIVIPDIGQNKFTIHGEVIAVGRGAWNYAHQTNNGAAAFNYIPMELTIGDKVMFEKGAAVELTVQG